ncbi:MAG: DUF192 domain-containing protein [Gammaproteobacteria bacterium]|nr:DUF192 domain-containing protein [Gammaproteobacteria bacterium]MCG3142933.1 hypothetical protein [Gammaproteobacteria bacterium]
MRLSAIRSRLPLLVFAALWSFALTIAHAESVGAVVTVRSANGQGHEFVVEVADTEERRERGLMFREELPADGGMIFIYDPPQVAAMWMKNTLIPLDMVFVDTEGRIAHVTRRTTPHSLEPISAGVPVSAVIELKGGSCDRLGIRVGDRVHYELAVTSTSSAPR